MPDDVRGKEKGKAENIGQGVLGLEIADCFLLSTAGVPNPQAVDWYWSLDC